MNAEQFLKENYNQLYHLLKQDETGFDFMEIYANQPKWISVEDSLPPEKVMKISEDVIVYDGKDVFIDCYDYEFNQWCRIKYKSTITYWQPLPTEPCPTT